MDEWLYELKRRVDAGYYTLETGEEAQEPFPWQNKTCQDCPFWLNSVCQVRAEYRKATADTCEYFDPANQEEGKRTIEERRARGFLRWWESLNGPI